MDKDEILAAQTPSADEFQFGISFPHVPQTTFECDYCGGWIQDNPKDDKIYWQKNVICLHLKDSKSERKVCTQCWIKTFDTILGKPNDK